MRITWRVGAWPSIQAGTTTEAQIDVKQRGGSVMIGRVVSRPAENPAASRMA